MPLSDDQFRDIFRDVFEHIDTEAPDAPEWSAITKPVTTRPAGWRGPAIALAAGAAVLIIVGVTAISSPWFRAETPPAASEAEGVIVSVTLADDIDAGQLERVIEALTTDPRVLDWRYVDKTEAYEEALLQWAGSEGTIRLLRENPSLLPATLRLLTANQTDAKAIQVLALEMFPPPTFGIMGFATARGTLTSVDLPISISGLHTYINEDNGFEIAYPVDWYQADEILAPALTSPPQKIEEVFSVGTYPLRPGAARCPNIPENALLDLGPEDVLLSIVLGGGSGDAPWPNAFGPDSFLPTDVPIDAQTCIDQPDLDARSGSFNLDGRDVQVFVAFGKFATPEKRMQTWQILDSFAWTETSTTTTTVPPASCPVTIPPQPGFAPPDGYPSTPVSGVWYGTEGLWTTIETEGISRPRKTVLWSVNFLGGREEGQPEVDVTWTRIDIPGEPTSNGGYATNAYTDEEGWFMIAGLDPNEPGCWQVTASYKGATLTYIYLAPGDASTTTTTLQTAADPLFGVEVPWVLLFDDGLEGILAIDPNERIGSRSVIDGQRPGDQPYRLQLANGYLVIGWGTVYANNVATRDSVPLGDATIFVPASDPTRVWLIDYPGGAILAGTPQVWQVSVSTGAQLSEPVAMDVDGFPSIGTPGGLAVETEAGIVLWDASIGETVDVLGTDIGFVSDVSRGINPRLAWCEAACNVLHITTIETGQDLTVTSPTGEPFDARSARFSNDQRFLAATTGNDVIVVDLESESPYTAFTIGDSTTPVSLGWAPFGPDLFASTNSFQQSAMEVAWHNALSRDTAIVALPFGGAVSFVVVDANEASGFLKREPNKPEACPPRPISDSPPEICGFVGW
ncbi:MAG: hypothetical protein BMS9Abin20_0646 [Acidimicrobiia bacterium]|nr:MAG: hypothetical protein BMS9Abin20_0646 [Acidimicrobiia bacterium]